MGKLKGFLVGNHLIGAMMATVGLYLISKHFAVFGELVPLALAQLPVILQSLVSILGAFLGFIVSTVAILAGVLEFRAFKRLERNNKTTELFSVFMDLIHLTAAALATCLVGLIFTTDGAKKWVLALNLIVLFWWLFKFLYCMYVFKQVLTIRYSQEKKNSV